MKILQMSFVTPSLDLSLWRVWWIVELLELVDE